MFAWSHYKRISLTALLFVLAVHCGHAQDLFGGRIVAKSKIFEIREGELDHAFTDLKAARAAIRQPVPPGAEEEVRGQLLDKMIATKMLLARATENDRVEGKKIADKLIEESKARAKTEASYRRQLLAVGTTPEKYEADLLEQATVKAVLNRELKSKEVVTPEQVRKFYEEKKERFQEPEKARVQHLLFPTRRIPSGEALPLEEREAKLAEAKRALERAKAKPEDFERLIVSFSQEPEKNEKRGELIVVKGGNTAPPAFEIATFSLKPGQVSDIVETPFGYHIIRLIEVLPSSTAPLEKVEEIIRNAIQEQGVQAKLNDYLDRLRKEYDVQVSLN